MASTSLPSSWCLPNPKGTHGWPSPSRPPGEALEFTPEPGTPTARMGAEAARTARTSDCRRTASWYAREHVRRKELEEQMPRYFGLDVHKSYVHGCELRVDEARNPQERHFRFPNCQEASLLTSNTSVLQQCPPPRVRSPAFPLTRRRTPPCAPGLLRIHAGIEHVQGTAAPGGGRRPPGVPERTRGSLAS